MASVALLLTIAAGVAGAPATPPPMRAARQPRAGADTAERYLDSLPLASATISLGEAGAPALQVRDFEFILSGTVEAQAREGGGTAATAQVRFACEPGASTADLARRVGSGARMAQVEARLERSGAAPIVLRLYDVRVRSARLVLNGDDVALAQQRLGLEESIAQLGAEQGEAERQLAAIESLAKQRLSPPLELARVRSNAELVGKRLAAQRRRLALVQRQLSRWIPILEEIVLTAARAEVVAAELSDGRDRAAAGHAPA